MAELWSQIGYPGANKARTWIDLGVIVGVPNGSKIVSDTGHFTVNLKCADRKTFIEIA